MVSCRSALRIAAVHPEVDVAQVAAQLLLALDQMDRRSPVPAIESAAVMPARPPPITRALGSTGHVPHWIGRRCRALATAMRTSSFALRGGRVRRSAMHPGILLADVGHLEQMRVQPGLAQRVLEERLVRARRAARHDHPVQRVFHDRGRDLLLRVLRAGVEDCARRTPHPAGSLAYSTTSGTLTTPPMLIPQWQTKTPMRGASSATSRSGGYDRLAAFRLPRASASSAEARAAAQLASITVSGMSFGSANAPATNTPGREVPAGWKSGDFGEAVLVQASHPAARPEPWRRPPTAAAPTDSTTRSNSSSCGTRLAVRGEGRIAAAASCACPEPPAQPRPCCGRSGRPAPSPPARCIRRIPCRRRACRCRRSSASMFGSCSRAITASLVAYMQHTDEQ